MYKTIHELVKNSSAEELNQKLEYLKNTLNKEDFFNYIHYKELIKASDNKTIIKIIDPVIFYEHCTIEKINILLDYGFNINIKDSFERNNALYVKSAEKCDFLLNKGIEKIGLNDNKFTCNPIFRASLQKLKILINHGYDIHQKDENGNSILLKSSNIEVIDFLIDNGFSINETNNKGENILFSSNLNTEDFKKIILRGADINKENKYNMTPLFLANIENMKILLESGAFVNHLSDDGKNCAFYCLSEFNLEKSMEKIKILIEKGIDLNQITNLSRNILYYAKSSEMIQFLLEHGVKRIELNPNEKNPKNIEKDSLIRQIENQINAKEEKKALSEIINEGNLNKVMHTRI